MLDKDRILKFFSKEDLNEAIRVYDKMSFSMKRDINLFTNSFLTPNIWRFYIENFNVKEFKVEANGGFIESERRVLSFNNIYEIKYPIILLQIENKSKFTNLKHKDYLGAIMSLGIQRDKVGDIRVYENKAYVPVIEEISSYIITNLSKIGKSPVDIRIVDDKAEIPSLNFQDIIITVPSLRIDSIVSKVCNISRSNTLEFIENGKILVDYNKAKNKGQEVKMGTTITVRGFGKFVVDEITGTTKNGKQKVKLQKYT